MSQWVYGLQVHVHAQTVVQAAVLAQSIADQVDVALYVETEAQLRAGVSLQGRHYLLARGSAEWLGRLFVAPRSRNLSGVIALIDSDADTQAQPECSLAGADTCLPASASPTEVMSAFKALTLSPMTD